MLVSAPCRLHFGLFHVPADGLHHGTDGTPIRKYGGLGMMVRDQRISVTVDPDTGSGHEPSAPLDARANLIKSKLPGSPPVRISVSGPPEHVGLGVGTALAMSVGTVLGWDPHSDQLPRLLGRGNRSGIGIEGFRRGGFIVDDGKIGDELPIIRERIEVPADWHVVLIRPKIPGDWYGDRERMAFGRNRTPANAFDTTRRLRDLADKQILPALKSNDFEAFSQGITLFNRIAGEPFAVDQGGPYASPVIADLIDQLLAWGVLGTGQSSWGPTVFAFTKSEDEAVRLQIRLMDSRNDIELAGITPADNRGYRVSTHEQTGNPHE